jgi:hypothetical protein
VENVKKATALIKTVPEKCISCKLPLPGLPDGAFPYQKSHFGYIWRALGMENVGIFMAIRNILSHLVYL